MLAVAQGQPPQASENASAGGNAKKRVKQEEERNEDDASVLEKERERLVYVLSKISLDDLVGALKAEVEGGSEGVRHLAALLPATVYPGRTLLTCLRCHKEYDPSYQSGGCKMRHPKDMVQEGEDRHWQYRCRRCKDVWGMSLSYNRFGVSDDHIKKGLCFEGAHEPEDQAMIEKEKWTASAGAADDESDDSGDAHSGYASSSCDESDEDFAYPY